MADEGGGGGGDWVFRMAGVGRPAPLVRVKVKFTVKFPVCCSRKLALTAILTVNLALIFTSGAGLTGRCQVALWVPAFPVTGCIPVC